MVSTGLTTGTAEREVLGIIMDSKYNFTCLVADDGNGVGGGMIYHPYHTFLGFSVALACIYSRSLRATSIVELMSSTGRCQQFVDLRKFFWGGGAGIFPPYLHVEFFGHILVRPSGAGHPVACAALYAVNFEVTLGHS